MIQCAILGIPKGMKKAISISIAFCLDFLIRNISEVINDTAFLLKIEDKPYSRHVSKTFSTKDPVFVEKRVAFWTVFWGQR